MRQVCIYTFDVHIMHQTAGLYMAEVSGIYNSLKNV